MQTFGMSMKLNGVIRFKALVLALVLSTQALGYDVKESIHNAQVYDEGKQYDITHLDTIQEPRKVFIYAHGSGGLNTSGHPESWSRWLSTLGYLVVVPDLYSIPGVVRNHDSRTKTKNTGAMKPYSYGRCLNPMICLSQASVRQAIRILKNSIFVDEWNIMGHSLGAGATSRMKLTKFTQGILSGYRCHRPVRWQSSMLTLSINYEDDPWMNEYEQGCLEQGIDYQLLLDGQGHQSYDPISRETVREFLEAAER